MWGLHPTHLCHVGPTSCTWAPCGVDTPGKGFPEATERFCLPRAQRVGWIPWLWGTWVNRNAAWPQFCGLHTWGLTLHHIYINIMNVYHNDTSVRQQPGFHMEL
jgi:hypothetical protein